MTDDNRTPKRRGWLIVAAVIAYFASGALSGALDNVLVGNLALLLVGLLLLRANYQLLPPQQGFRAADVPIAFTTVASAVASTVVSGVVSGFYSGNDKASVSEIYAALFTALVLTVLFTVATVRIGRRVTHRP